MTTIIYENVLLCKQAMGTIDDMASSSTLCRMENNADRHFAIKVHELMIDKFIKSHKIVPNVIAKIKGASKLHKKGAREVGMT